MLLFVGKVQAVLAEVCLEGLSSGREESGRMEVTAWQFRLVGERRAGGWK